MAENFNLLACLAPTLQAALDSTIAGGQYQQALARWGDQDEAIAH